MAVLENSLAVSTSIPVKFSHGNKMKKERLLVQCIQKKNSKDKDREREPQPYRVTVITPPKRALGTHKLPPNMQCGESVEVSGEIFIISSVVYRYQLRRGKYEQSEKCLEVQTSGRYLVNLFLDDLIQKS